MQGAHSIPLDLLQSATTDAASTQTTYTLKNESPAIIFSGSPAVLALIAGEPVLRPVGDNLQKVLNTRSMSKPIRFKDHGAKQTTSRHRDLNKVKNTFLANQENQPLGNPKQSSKDLLLATGPPQFTAILGTNLLYVSNSGNDIFMDNVNQTYCVLPAGRWFSASALQGAPGT